MDPFSTLWREFYTHEEAGDWTAGLLENNVSPGGALLNGRT